VSRRLWALGTAALLAALVSRPAFAGEGSSADKSALVRYKLSHGYLVGDQARFDRLKTQAAAAAARLHPSANTALSPHDPVASPSFEGLNENDLAPPDPTGAVGPFSYLQAINLQVGIYSRAGNLLASAPFSTLTGSGTDFLSDPQMLWDSNTNRFYYLILDVGDELNPKSTMLWGFSKSNNPTTLPGSFCNYVANFGWGGTIADYPKLGTTSDFLLIGVNIYPNLVTFLESDVGWISKPKGSNTFRKCPSAGSFKLGKQTALLNDDGATLSSTPEPAQQADPSSTGWIVSVPDPTNSGATGDKLELYKVTKNQNGTANIQKVGTPVAVPNYSPPPPAPQQGTVHTIDTLDGRLIHAVSAVDPAHGTATALWTSHAVFGGAGSEVRWYEIDVANAALFQSGTVNDLSLYAFNGSVSSDRVYRSSSQKGFGNNLVVNFSTSSATAYPAIQMVSKVGANAQSGFVLVKQSPGPEDGFDCFELQKCRWGDYSGAVPDPAAPLTGSVGKVWMDNMWASGISDPLNATWRTWIWAATP
jgi:hypothetical protein